jgi:hypothetical protein
MASAATLMQPMRAWRGRSPVQPETGYIPPQSGRLQYPDADGHDYHDIQNRFDAGGHGNVPVDQVQRHPDYDQHNDKIQQRHFRAPSIQARAIRCPMLQASSRLAWQGPMRAGSA